MRRASSGSAARLTRSPARLQSPLQRVGAMEAFREAAAQFFGAALQGAEAAAQFFGAALQGT